MKLKFNRKSGGIKESTREAISGWLFLLPWIVGLIYFFIVPFVQGVIYSMNKISFTNEGVKLSYVGFKNYKAAFEDMDFIKKLTDSLVEMVPQVIIIVFFSLFIAILLREKFRGRGLARSIFFLPVIISSGVVISVLKETVMLGSSTMDAKTSAYLFQVPSFQEALANLGLPSSVLNLITSTINQLFDLTWKSGVQILLLLAAVNNIPKSTYEVADIEGATEWEKFWKITFPMVSPTLLVAVIYSIVDSFTDYSNSVMYFISEKMSLGFFEYSSTVAFIYFICIFFVIGIVGLVLSRRTYSA